MSQVVYPIFRIGQQPNFLDGVVFFVKSYVDEDGNIVEKVQIVDDTNLAQASLAERRLALLRDGVPLRNLGKAVFFLGDFIKLAKPNTWLIDSIGKVFCYNKTRMVKLKFRKIKKVIPIPAGGALIEVEGIPGRFKSLWGPRDDEIYAGVLEDRMGYILYGLYRELHKDTVRKI